MVFMRVGNQSIFAVLFLLVRFLLNEQLTVLIVVFGGIAYCISGRNRDPKHPIVAREVTRNCYPQVRIWEIDSTNQSIKSTVVPSISILESGALVIVMDFYDYDYDNLGSFGDVRETKNLAFDQGNLRQLLLEVFIISALILASTAWIS